MKKGIQFIKPVWCSNAILGTYGEVDFHNTNDPLLTDVAKKKITPAEYVWLKSMYETEESYNTLLQHWSPQQAREVLPNSLKTEIVVTANLREWRHIFRLRTSNGAHPEIKSLMGEVLNEFQNKIPILFEGINK